MAEEDLGKDLLEDFKKLMEKADIRFKEQIGTILESAKLSLTPHNFQRLIGFAQSYFEARLHDIHDLEFGGPRVLQTVNEILTKERLFIESIQFPEGTKFECIKCGDCCRWNYFRLEDLPIQLIDQIFSYERNPHGHWEIVEDLMSLVFPYREENKMKFIQFSGPLPQDSLDFLKQTGRTHGYWVMEQNGKILAYSPMPCIHLGYDNLCKIYAERPKICRLYTCKRHPVS